MILPSKINICGIDYKIKMVPDHFKADCIHFGEIDYKGCEISIASDMPYEMQVQTLMHEWLHGALFSLGFDEHRTNEQLVQALSTAMFQTFSFKPTGDIHMEYAEWVKKHIEEQLAFKAEKENKDV